jgi:hypothetical protein
MMRDLQPPRQPLFWAALAFSLGLWTGVHAWRPASWWVISVVVFVLASSWFAAKRAWASKGLALTVWVLLGAFLIQIHGQPTHDPGIAELADGRSVIFTAHVIREGYARETGPGSIRESIDVETETIESSGETVSVRTGVRLAIYEKVGNRAIG